MDLEGQQIICREMLMDGPLSEHLDQAFYNSRAAYLSQLFGGGPEKYEKEVKPELEKLRGLTAGSEVYLWFEYDLFCQINLWSCCSWLRKYNQDLRLYWVTPGHLDWKGFGLRNGEELRALVSGAATSSISTALLEEFHVSLAKYKSHDYTLINSYITKGSLSIATSSVLEAQLRRMSKDNELSDLEKMVEKKIAEIGPLFSKVFQWFCQEHGIYGLGDLQFRLLYERVIEKKA